MFFFSNPMPILHPHLKSVSLILFNDDPQNMYSIHMKGNLGSGQR